MPKTFAPDSVAEATTLGVAISVKPRPSSVVRNPRRDAAASRQTACRRGCRHVVDAWSSSVDRPTSSVRAPQLDRRRPCDREQLDDGRGQLGTARCLGVRRHRAGDPDDTLLADAVDRGPCRLLGHDDLCEPAAIADDDERHGGEPASPVHPALEPDLLTGVRRERGREHASAAGTGLFHGGHLLGALPGRCGRSGRSRCHHTFADRTGRPLGPLTGAGRRRSGFVRPVAAAHRHGTTASRPAEADFRGRGPGLSARGGDHPRLGWIAS